MVAKGMNRREIQLLEVVARRFVEMRPCVGIIGGKRRAILFQNEKGRHVKCELSLWSTRSAAIYWCGFRRSYKRKMTSSLRRVGHKMTLSTCQMDALSNRPPSNTSIVFSYILELFLMMHSTRMTCLQLVVFILGFFASTRVRTSVAFAPRRCLRCRLQWHSLSAARLETKHDAFIEPDYLITDSIGIVNRPSLFEISTTNPTMLVRTLLLIVGTGISISNIVGNYSDFYIILQTIAIPLALILALLDYKASIPPYTQSPTNAVSPNIRMGAVDDAVVHLYASLYTAGAVWLALRVGPLCPSWLTSLDPLFGALAASIFIFSLVAPMLTLLHDSGIVNAEKSLRGMVSMARQQYVSPKEPLPPLTETELLRAKSLIAVGVVGCLFAPISIKLALVNDATWWNNVVLTDFPAQGILESSTALFGIIATQASMIAHTSAKAGIAPFQQVAPAFAVVCFMLAIVPCISSLYWLGNDISFFELYSM